MDDLELIGPADINGLSWDWSKQTHEHDSDPYTFFAALTILSLIVVEKNLEHSITLDNPR